jgi:hypothetical protein
MVAAFLTGTGILGVFVLRFGPMVWGKGYEYWGLMTALTGGLLCGGGFNAAAYLLEIAMHSS